MESHGEPSKRMKWFQMGGEPNTGGAQTALPETPNTGGPNTGGLTDTQILQKTDYGTWHWFILLSILFVVLWYGLLQTANIQQVKKNWNKYRCSPSVLPFTTLYGYDISENFNYCVSGVMSLQLGKYLGPFGYILNTVLEALMTFLNNLNSLRMMFASLVGGVKTVLQDLVDRMKLLMSQVKVTGLKLQQLFKRTFGVMYAIVYVGLSATTAGLNFADTTLFKFLDTFCFDGNTLLAVKGKGLVPIRAIQLGDILEETGSVVTSTYRFIADGQPMVRFPSTNDYPYPITVSTNHFVKDSHGNWIQAKEHPDAEPVAPWNGGEQRLLYCLDTDKHMIPVGPYLFSDYDETTEQDAPTMKWIEEHLNGLPPSPQKEYPWPYQPCIEKNAHILYKDGKARPLASVQIGDTLTSGRVIGIVRRHVYETIMTDKGTCLTPSTLVWTGTRWERAGHLYVSHHHETPVEMMECIIVGGSHIELSTGEHVRDFIEYLSPDAETLTATCLRSDRQSPVGFSVQSAFSASSKELCG